MPAQSNFFWVCSIHESTDQNDKGTEQEVDSNDRDSYHSSMSPEKPWQSHRSQISTQSLQFQAPPQSRAVSKAMSQVGGFLPEAVAKTTKATPKTKGTPRCPSTTHHTLDPPEMASLFQKVGLETMFVAGNAERFPFRENCCLPLQHPYGKNHPP